MRLGIFGTGYVGLVTAVCFAELGHAVVGIDKDPDTVARLSDGIPTFYEPGLEKKLSSALESSRLSFSASPDYGVDHSEIIFLCVGTPARTDGRADLRQVEEVAQVIAPMLDGYKLIVERSTVPVRTAFRIDRTIRLLAGRDLDYDVASNPEFTREGSAIEDFLHPDRIVIGADTDRARSLLLQLYAADFDCTILATDVKTAEVIKHAANAFLASKVSFINMIADFCEAVGVDVAAVAKGVGLDRRISPHFLDAGLGFGGSCLPKDLKAFIQIAGEVGVDFSLLREVERINRQRVERLLKKIERALWISRGKTVGVLGLAFKQGTDDVRESPSLKVIPELCADGATLRAYDPYASESMARVYPPDDRLSYVASPYEAAANADALVILTDWAEFRRLDLERIRALMRRPIVVDGRNLFDPTQMVERGFEYYSLGRGDTDVPMNPDSIAHVRPVDGWTELMSNGGTGVALPGAQRHVLSARSRAGPSRLGRVP